MSESASLDRITEIVRDELDDDSINLELDTQADAVPGWDSLAHVRIVIAVENAFGLRFNTSEITGLKHVGDLVDLINRYQSG